MVVAQRKYDNSYNYNYDELFNPSPKQVQSPKVKPVKKKNPLKVVGILIQLSIVMAAIIYLVSGQVAIDKVRVELRDIQREVASMEKENQNLHVSLATISDISKIEDVAINAMGMVKPDSNNIITIEGKSTSENNSTPNIKSNANKGVLNVIEDFYNKILGLIN